MPSDTYGSIKLDTAEAVGAMLVKKLGGAGYAPKDWADMINLLGPYPERTLSGQIVSFSDGADDVPSKAVVATVEASQSGTGDPSPSNPRPITPKSSVTVTQTGANIVPLVPIEPSTSGNVTFTFGTSEVTVNGLSNSAYPQKFYLQNFLLKAGKYTASKTIIGTVPAGGYLYINIRNASTTQNITSLRSYSVSTFTLSEDTYIDVLCVAETIGINWENVKLQIMIEPGETASTFAPYTGTDYTAALSVAQHGGTKNLVTGDETGKGYTVFDGSEGWTYTQDGNGHARIMLNMTSYLPYHDGAGTIEIMSNIIKPSTSTSDLYYPQHYTGGINGNAYLVIGVDITEITRVEDWKDLLENTVNMQLVYPLETPTTASGTPQKINTLAGDNTFYQDGTGGIEVTYRAQPT